MKLTKLEKFLLLLDFAKDSLHIFWQKIYATKIAKAAACLSVLFLTSIIVFSYKPHAQSLPSCNSLPDGTAAVAGTNCNYFGLPLCNTISPPSAVRHRVNCADLIDLPLCSDIVSSGTVRPGKNCVNLCSSYTNPDPAKDPANVRGEDYAVFNQDCIRFCDAADESDVIKTEGVNCVVRKCHQLPSGTNPAPGTNCNLAKCNLLTPDELNKTKFDDSTKRYCDSDNLKCYNFTQAQLPYVRVRSRNPTCTIHDCTPDTASCGPDDVQNVTNQGPAYTSVYVNFVNGGLDIANKSFCKRPACKPIVRNQYRCVTAVGGSEISGNDDRDKFLHPQCSPTERFACTSDGTSITGNPALDTVRSTSCDSSGAGASCVYNSTDKRSYCYKTLECVGNYCVKITDCNLPENSTNTDCAIATHSAVPDGTIDPFESWFYRPIPAGDAYNESSGVINRMSGDMCYTESDLRDRRLGRTIWFLWTSYWFHSSWIDEPRSPGACGARRDGGRGGGYIYLGGTDGLLNNRPTSNTIYFRGYARTDFSSGIPKHKVTVCLRFRNTLALRALGERECGVNAWFDDFTSQACGQDECRELTVSEDNGTDCLMNSGLASSSASDKSCAALIDNLLRVRAVKYNDKICAYLDSKGQLAYNGMFFDGTENITFTSDDENANKFNPINVCVNDPTSANGINCAGFSSNSSRESAEKWRTVLRAQYVGNNRPPSSTLRGYLDKAGRLYREQPCPRVTLRLPPPDLYNVGNVTNSSRLFSPPIRIRNAVKIRGGEDVVVGDGFSLGKTDFHKPEIKVQYGLSVFKMSLGFGYTGYETGGDAESYPTSPPSITATTNFNGKDYQAELFVRKEFFYNVGLPQFCLYQKMKDQNGVYIDPMRIACVERNYPDVNNTKDYNLDRSLPLRKVMVYPRPGNTYSDSKIILRYVDGGADKTFNNCSGDDSCTPELILGNADATQPTCDQNVENHKICVQREQCSAIYIECIQNEIALSNARNAGQDLRQFLSVRENCNSNLVPICNRKKGITFAGGDIYNLTPPDSAIDQNAYGWFNELCFVSGFRPKLKNVVARTTATGVMGKCLIDTVNSPYLNDGRADTNCNDGGKAPNCLCLEASADYQTNAGEEVRLQTPREAGLCIDMPQPPFCPAIDYTQVPNSDPNDPEYINNSLGKNAYDNATGVHLTHQDRTNGVASGRAEFVRSLPGMDDVQGECKGFWTYARNSLGVTLIPLRNCEPAAGNNAAWSAGVRNQCVRFTCPAVTTAGPDASGVYQGGYAVSEIGEQKGAANGFAIWDRYTKTNDFLESRSALNCIAGFKPNGSVAVTNSSGVISGYSGGSMPTRACNQLGNWGLPTNSCVRIACPALNPARPTSSTQSSLWAQWYNNGGATFPSVSASRSAVRVQPESISYGTCDNSLGFFQIGAQPSRECDYLGNWGPVRNPCTTSCSAITQDIEASQPNNGFAKWNAAAAVSLSAGYVEGNFFDQCVAGYVTNPYPPRFDSRGNPLDASIANDLTRPAENPKRVCQAGITTAGSVAGVWSTAINGCINQCPGADVDSRVGVGVTIHPMRSSVNGLVSVNWDSVNLGQYSYATNWTGLESLFGANYFQQGRSNGYYLLRRYCNSNGRWSDPEVMCLANTGQINNATYATSAPAGYQNSVVAGSTTAVDGQCVKPGNWKANNNTAPAPQRTCVYESGNQYIDKVYWRLNPATQDCEAVTCPTLSYLGDKVKFNITTRKAVGFQAQGTCLNNEVNRSGAMTWAGVPSNLVAPTMVCQEDGTWSNVQNLGNCKLGCDIGENAYGVNSNSDEGDKYFYHRGFSLQHGQSVVFGIYQGAYWVNCSTVNRAFYCDDGSLTNTTDVRIDTGSNCEFRSFSKSAKAFTANVSYVSTSNRDWVGTQFRNNEATTSSKCFTNKYNLPVCFSYSCALNEGSVWWTWRNDGGGCGSIGNANYNN